MQEGFWYSSHEQWKLMVLPYLELPLVKTVFTNSERLGHVAKDFRNGQRNAFEPSH